MTLREPRTVTNLKEHVNNGILPSVENSSGLGRKRAYAETFKVESDADLCRKKLHLLQEIKLSSLTDNLRSVASEYFFLQQGGNILDYSSFKRSSCSRFRDFMRSLLKNEENEDTLKSLEPSSCEQTCNAGKNGLETDESDSRPPSVEKIDNSNYRLVVDMLKKPTLEPSLRYAYESKIIDRVSELRHAGLWSSSRLPKCLEPCRRKCHWDFLLEEMQWLSADFAQERKMKRNLAKKITSGLQKYFRDRDLQVEAAEKERVRRMRKLASTVSKDVMNFWRNIDKVLRFKQQALMEEKRKEALDMHLQFIIDQTEKYSLWLTQRLRRETENTDSPQTLVKVESTNADVIDFRKSKEVADLADRLKSEEAKEGDTADTDYIPEEDSDIEIDDQSSLIRAEKLLTEDEVKDELNALDYEGRMSFDDLVESLPPGYVDHIGEPVEQNETDSDNEFSSSSSEDSEMSMDSSVKSDPDAKPDSCDIVFSQSSVSCNRPEFKEDDDRLTKMAIAAHNFQPKGYTLETTKVLTPVPFLLKHKLREYQHVGLDWLASMYENRLNGILADEMGLGKTIQTIALFAHLACSKGIWGPHLIVVPTSVMLNWELEFKKWCPAFKILTYYGSAKERKEKRKGWTKSNAFHVCITSYKLVLHDALSFRRKKWKFLVLDEAQNIKNFKSQRWQCLLGFQPTRRLLLTGTPLQNSLMELWSLMHFLMPHVFSSHREFKEWFSIPLSGMVEGNQQINDTIVKRLHKILRPFILRRLKSEVEKQMPKKFEHVVLATLSKRQRFLYDDFMSNTKTKETLASGHYMSVISVLMQLRKVCNHPDLFDPRPVQTPFVCQALNIQLPKLIFTPFFKDPLESLDYFNSDTNFAGCEFGLSSFSCLRIRNLQIGKRLMEEARATPTTQAQTDKVTSKANPRPSTAENLIYAHIYGQKCSTQLLQNVPSDEQNHCYKINRPGVPVRPFGILGLPAVIKSKPIVKVFPRYRGEDSGNHERQVYCEVLTTESRTDGTFASPSKDSVDPYILTYAREKSFRANVRRTMASVNERKCSVKPVFGSDLRAVVKCLATSFYTANGYEACECVHRLSVQRLLDAYFSYCDTLVKLIKTFNERLDENTDCYSKFLLYIPPVFVPSTIRCDYERLNEMDAFDLVIRDIKYLLPSPCLMLFPERRLIQYDCGKLQVLDRLLRKLKSESHRVLIFTQMTRMLDILEVFLTYHGHTYLRLDGTTKIEKRQFLVETFNQNLRIFCFILSTRSGGIGVNLTGADTVIFYDSDWNPTMDAQAQDRCHRIGQTRDVHIFRLISSFTVEENILKKANQKRILGNVAIDGAGFSGALNKQDIRSLFELPSQADETDVNKKSVATDDEITGAQFEEALEAVEDESDVLATRELKAETGADAAEFDEANTDSLQPGEVSGSDVAISGAEKEVQALVKGLSGIERYALNFMESNADIFNISNAGAVENELKIEHIRREWELSRLRAIQEEEERRAEEDEDDDVMYTYEDVDGDKRWVASNRRFFLPTWCPPTPPVSADDVYIDLSSLYLYDSTPIPDEELRFSFTEENIVKPARNKIVEIVVKNPHKNILQKREKKLNRKTAVIGASSIPKASNKKSADASNKNVSLKQLISWLTKEQHGRATINVQLLCHIFTTHGYQHYTPEEIRQYCKNLNLLESKRNELNLQRKQSTREACPNISGHANLNFQSKSLFDRINAHCSISQKDCDKMTEPSSLNRVQLLPSVKGEKNQRSASSSRNKEVPITCSQPSASSNVFLATRMSQIRSNDVIIPSYIFTPEGTVNRQVAAYIHGQRTPSERPNSQSTRLPGISIFRPNSSKFEKMTAGMPSTVSTQKQTVLGSNKQMSNSPVSISQIDLRNLLAFKQQGVFRSKSPRNDAKVISSSSPSNLNFNLLAHNQSVRMQSSGNPPIGSALSNAMNRPPSGSIFQMGPQTMFPLKRSSSSEPCTDTVPTYPCQRSQAHQPPVFPLSHRTSALSGTISTYSCQGSQVNVPSAKTIQNTGSMQTMSIPLSGILFSPQNVQQRHFTSISPSSNLQTQRMPLTANANLQHPNVCQANAIPQSRLTQQLLTGTNSPSSFSGNNLNSVQSTPNDPFLTFLGQQGLSNRLRASQSFQKPNVIPRAQVISAARINESPRVLNALPSISTLRSLTRQQAPITKSPAQFSINNLRSCNFLTVRRPATPLVIAQEQLEPRVNSTRGHETTHRP